MKRALGRVIACVLLSGTVTACGSDGSSGGGTGGATGGSGGSTTGGTGGSTGGSGGSAAGGSGGSATGGSAGQVPCTLTVSGSVTGSADCTSSASSEAIAIGAEPEALIWNLSEDVADTKVNWAFHYPNPVEATTYQGGDPPAPTCTASVTSNDFVNIWNYDSSPATAGGNCSMTITSAVDDSSNLTKRYVIHGSGTATVVKASDQSTVVLDVTF